MFGRKKSTRGLATTVAPLVAAAALCAGVLTIAGPSAAEIAKVAGGAFGQQVSVSLLDEAPITSGPLPTVTLPLSAQDVSAAAPSAAVRGPEASAPFGGRLLETGGLTATSKGNLGWEASTSSASAATVDILAGTLTAAGLRSTCNSASGESSGSTTAAAGTLILSETERIPLPPSPEPNTTFTGTDAASGNGFKVVLNEQTVDRGSITVTAAHVTVDGPTAVGEIIVARSWCATAKPGEELPAGTPSPPSEPGSPAPATDAGGAGKATTAAAPAAAAAPGSVTAQAAATALIGKACGYYVNVGLFGGGQDLRGCGQTANEPGAISPSVELPAGGAAAPVTAADADGAAAKYGPATIFGGRYPCEETGARNCPRSSPVSGPITVSVEGTLAAGTVTASSDIVLHPAPKTVPCFTGYGPVCTEPGGFGPAPVEGDEMHVKCTANETAVTGSVTMKNSVLATTTDAEGAPKDMEGVPDSPPVNYTRSGVISNVGDVFTAVYNEQIVNPDGSLTVNGVHLYLFGPTAIGDMVKGSVTCGRTPNTVARTDTKAPSCGKIVVAPNGPEDPTPRVPRTELVGVFDAGGLQSIDNVQKSNAEVSIGADPNGAPYLRFEPGQTRPLTLIATRIDESQPMTWSFEAKDKAGNVTRSTSCPTDSERINVVLPTPGQPGAGGAGGTGAAGAGAGTGGTGAGANRAGMATTGANAQRLGAAGTALLASGAVLVLSGRRRRRTGDGHAADSEGADGEAAPPELSHDAERDAEELPYGSP